MKKAFSIIILVVLIIVGLSSIKFFSSTYKVFFVSGNELYPVTRIFESSESDDIYMSVFELLKKGPTFMEKLLGIKSSEISKLELKSIEVRNNTAYLDFSRNIEMWSGSAFDVSYGIGQIVYTFTAFDSIDKVVFIVEGRKKDLVLGGEGYIINQPLSRKDIDIKIRE